MSASPDQGLWYLLNQIDLTPPERPAWPLDSIPPFGVPYVISKAFWGGLWGAGVALLLERLTGATYWTTWIHRRRGGANPRCFVVPPIKGERIPALWAARWRRFSAIAPWLRHSPPCGFFGAPRP